MMLLALCVSASFLSVSNSKVYRLLSALRLHKTKLHLTLHHPSVHLQGITWFCKNGFLSRFAKGLASVRANLIFPSLLDFCSFPFDLFIYRFHHLFFRVLPARRFSFFSLCICLFSSLLNQFLPCLSIRNIIYCS